MGSQRLPGMRLRWLRNHECWRKSRGYCIVCGGLIEEVASSGRPWRGKGAASGIGEAVARESANRVGECSVVAVWLATLVASQPWQ